MFTCKVYKNLASIMAKNRSQKNSCITNITDLDEIATDDHETDNHNSPGPLTQLMDDHSLHYQCSHRPGPSDIHMDVDEDGGDPDETLDTVERTLFCWRTCFSGRSTCHNKYRSMSKQHPFLLQKIHWFTLL